MAAQRPVSEALREAVAVFGPPPERSMERLGSVATRQELTPREMWQHAGHTPTRVGLVVEGLLRMFFTRKDGRQFNKSFIRAGDWIAVLDGLVLNEPSRYSIEAMARCQLITLPYRDLEALYADDLYWSTVGRKIVERLYVKKVRREASFLLDSAEERYREFRREYADIENDVADYQIASYLGITPVALSRIKKRITLASETTM